MRRILLSLIFLALSAGLFAQSASWPDSLQNNFPVENAAFDQSDNGIQGEPRAIWVKTNILAWALFQMNAAAEFELFNHVTVSLPVYFGTFNWFVNSIKFNTLEFRPEIRWYYRKDCTGLFAAIHGTIGSYNYALGGQLRYQDHLGTTPAIGGGLTLGWRIPLRLFGTDRLGLEFAIGAAALALNYDTFYNVPNGKYFEKEIKKTYFGIDNISVTATYRFDCKRRTRR